MVDWDRVEELRSRGWDWDRIAGDPKVGFHADASAGDPGRALRALYRRNRSRTRPTSPSAGGTPGAAANPAPWGWLRVGYVAVPGVGVWFALAYFLPSPVGVLLPALPYLGLVLAGLAFALAFGLWRTAPGRRWSSVYRKTVIGGVVLGLVVSGLIGLTGVVAFGCPYLPSAASLTAMSEPANVSGWEQVHASPWQVDGKPVLFFYGAVWCPYCSASSWAIWKAISSFGGSVPGSAFSEYSSSASAEPYKNTPEVVLEDATSSATVAVEVAEYTGGVDGAAPTTSSCYQQAYVAAYETGIPFVVIGGQYLHVGSLYSPEDLAAWADGADGGDLAVKNSVHNETAAPSGGDPWQTVQSQAWWLMALLVKAAGASPAFEAATYGWSKSTQASVTSDFTDFLS